MAGFTRKRSSVIIELSDELVQELVTMGKLTHTSVRELIRRALQEIAQMHRVDIETRGSKESADGSR